MYSSDYRNRRLQCYDWLKKLFWSACRNEHDNIRKIVTSQGDDYTAGFLQDYAYFKTYCKMRAIDVDRKPIQQISFTANLDRAGETALYLIIEEAKETVLDFSQRTVRGLYF